MRIHSIVLVAAISLCSVAPLGIAAPVIDHITPASVAAGKEVVISGAGLGGSAKGSEVIADAQMVAVPKPLCLKCKPLIVRWYNEPTGFIQYHIEIKQRWIEGICPNQKRGMP